MSLIEVPVKQKRKSAVKTLDDPRFAGHPVGWYLLSDDQEASLRSLFGKGVHARKIVAKLGLSRDQFTYFRIKLGLLSRSTKYRPEGITASIERMIKNDYFKRKSIKYIANKYKTSTHNIAKLVKIRRWRLKKYEVSDTVQIRLFMLPEEHAEVQKRAFAYGVSVPQYIRIHYLATKETPWPAGVEPNLPLFSDHPVTKKSK